MDHLPEINPCAIEIVGAERIAELAIIERLIDCCRGAIYTRNTASLYVFLKTLYRWVTVGIVRFSTRLLRARPRTRLLIRTWDELLEINSNEQVLEKIERRRLICHLGWFSEAVETFLYDESVRYRLKSLDCIIQLCILTYKYINHCLSVDIVHDESILCLQDLSDNGFLNIYEYRFIHGIH